MKLLNNQKELIKLFGAPTGCTYSHCSGCEPWKCPTYRDLEAIRQKNMSIQERLLDDLNCLETSRDKLLEDLKYNHEKAYCRLSFKEYNRKVNAACAQYEDKRRRLIERAEAEERLSSPEPLEFKYFNNR